MDELHRPTTLPMPTAHLPSSHRPYTVADLTQHVTRRGPIEESLRESASVTGGESGAEVLDQLRTERDEYLDALRRLAAEFDNYRKRMLREQTDHLDRASERLLQRLLPVLDTVELAAEHHPDTLGPVHRQLQDTLAAEGLQRIEPLGAPFDPAEHQAAEHETVVPLRPADPRPQATVTGVLRAGYRFRDHVLRPALVRVHG